MIELIADSGSTKTDWALVERCAGQPVVAQLFQTQGLNPLYVQPEAITDALRQVLAQSGARPNVLSFYGSGCGGDRVPLVEQALRRALTPTTHVRVASDLLGAARSLASECQKPFIACIMGTGAVAALYDPSEDCLQPVPALGYILGDEGSGAWLGRRLLSDYLKGQMPSSVVQAFEADFGHVTPEQAISHVYREVCPNRYLATFAAFLGRVLSPHVTASAPQVTSATLRRYCEALAFEGMEAFWTRNVMRIATLGLSSTHEVRMVGSVAWHLQNQAQQVALLHDYEVSEIVASPMQGLIDGACCVQ